MLVVQMIEILWTKATRGSPGADRRVALPRALPVDVVAGPYFVHRFQMAEWRDFELSLVASETKPSPPEDEHVLQIAVAPEGGYLLGLSGTPHAGQPLRHAKNRAIRLEDGAFARLAINARHTNYSGQYYSETIFNVACGADIPRDRFLSRPPNHLLDMKVHLF